MNTRAQPVDAAPRDVDPDTAGQTDEESTDLGPIDEVAPLVFRAEPGACAGRLEPGQTLIPDSLASKLDYHVWPSASPLAAAARARTVCDHVDYEQIWHENPDFFTRRAQVGAPALATLWEARRVLAEFGTSLAYDVQVERIDGELALGVYGAGVVGRLSDREWRAVAGLLTTCCSTVREPREDVALGRVVRPARRPVLADKRVIPTRVRPVGWEIGDWVHTWWGYPFHGTLVGDCVCPAHTPEAVAVQFGPGAQSIA